MNAHQKRACEAALAWSMLCARGRDLDEISKTEMNLPSMYFACGYAAAIRSTERKAKALSRAKSNGKKPPRSRAKGRK